MHPYAHAAALGDIVESQVRSTLSEALAAAGLPFRVEAQGPVTARVWSVQPWPKAIEVEEEVGLGPGREPSGVPEAWRRFGAALWAVLPDHFPVVPARGARPSHLGVATPLASMPAALAAWYRARPPIEGWVSAGQGRLPSLSWRRGVGVRLYFLVEGRAAPPSVFLALSLALQRNRVLNLPCPAAPGWEDPVAFAYALGGDELRAAAELVSRPADTYASLQPSGTPGSEELDRALIQLQRGLEPRMDFSVQLQVGAGPVFTPSGTYAPTVGIPAPESTVGGAA